LISQNNSLTLSSQPSTSPFFQSNNCFAKSTIQQLSGASSNLPVVVSPMGPASSARWGGQRTAPHLPTSKAVRRHIPKPFCRLAPSQYAAATPAGFSHPPAPQRPQSAPPLAHVRSAMGRTRVVQQQQTLPTASTATTTPFASAPTTTAAATTAVSTALSTTNGRGASLESEFAVKMIQAQLEDETTVVANLPPEFRHAAVVAAGIFAKRTWYERRRIWNLVRRHAQQQQLQHLPIGMQAVAWLSTMTHVKDSTMIGYASGLRALCHRMSLQTPLLDLFAAGLSATGTSRMEIQHATPVSRDLALALVDRARDTLRDPRFAVGLWLAWKTAARWDDVLHLVRESLLKVIQNPNGSMDIIIEWGQLKTNRRRDFRATGWTVLREEQRLDLVQLTQDVFRRLRPEEALTTITTQKMRRLVRLHPDAALLNISAHSFKRGASDRLWAFAAQGQCSARLIPALLKHKDEFFDFPTSTVRYCTDKSNLALALGTQELTRLL